ncbi:MAG: hypothetical protein AB1730_05135 [Myxococcota bacterium]
MLTTLLSLLFLAATPASAAPSAECESLVPGKSLGTRYSLGTVLKAPEAVVPDAIPGWFRPSDPAGKNVRLRFDDAKTLVEIEAPLPKCVALGERRIQTGNPLVLAAALGTCGQVAVNEGANIVTCNGVTLVATPTPLIRVQKSTPAAAGECAVYLDDGGSYDASGVHAASPGFSHTLEATKPVCVTGLKKPLTTKTIAADVKAMAPPCQEKAMRGGTHLTCGDLVYSFAGPPATLATISFAPRK